MRSLIILTIAVLLPLPVWAKARHAHVPVVEAPAKTATAKTGPDAAAPAQPTPSDAVPPAFPTGHPRSTTLPLPRFSTLKAGKVYVRSGPGMEYPFEWVYRREGLPVEIIQEYDQWRQIRDSDGATGWVNELLISTKRAVLVQGKGLADVHDDGTPGARVIAQAEPGVIGVLKRCNPQFCELTAGGYRGWVARGRLWGIYANELLN